MVKATNGGKLVVWKLAFRPPVVALNQCVPHLIRSHKIAAVLQEGPNFII